MLNNSYATKFPESVDPNLSEGVVYNGKYSLTDATRTGLDREIIYLSYTHLRSGSIEYS